MNTNKLIRDIYKKFKKPPRNREELRLDEFVEKLSPHHSISVDEDEVVINDLEDYNPFRRFLIRSMTATLEFDRHIAFVFRNHILFFNKETDEMRIHIKPDEEPKSWFSKLFGN